MSKTYTVILKETVQKQLKGLPATYFKKVKTAILALEENPLPHGAIKLKGGNNEYRIRVAVCRIL